MAINSSVGADAGTGPASSQRDEVAVRDGLGGCLREGLLVDTFDREAGIGDHLDVGGRRLTFTCEVVAEEDRVGDVKRKGL